VDLNWCDVSPKYAFTFPMIQKLLLKSYRV